MTKSSKSIEICFEGANPLKLLGDAKPVDQSAVSSEHRETMLAVAAAIKAYSKAAVELLNGKYRHLAETAPEHLSNPGNILVASCTDGVVIRYEKKVDTSQFLLGYLPVSLADGVLLVSQNLVRCLPEGTTCSTTDSLGVDLRLSVTNPAAGGLLDIASAKILFDTVITRPDVLPQPPQKPYCLLSVQNSLDVEIHGETIPDAETARIGEQFIARTRMKLGVGWECIEVFPFIEANQWKPEYAHAWAENDLLASMLIHQLRESHYNSLDPRATARRQYAKLLNDFKLLLDSNPEREQTLQAFLQENPTLLSPTKKRMWPKLPLGDRITDFVFLDATNDYLLVELEKSTHLLFRKDGHATAELTHAQGQIVDWKRYLEDNLASVQRESGLVGISANPHALIVIGRSNSLSLINRRKLTSMMNESPKVRIMTYDDVYENAKAVIENILGPIWDSGGNTHIYFPENESHM